jgi:hypothetical protein
MAVISALGWFIPIFAFLLVFIVIYAILKKTGVLGSAEPVMLFVSLILASFFVLEASLVEFIRLSSAWFGVLMILIFFLILGVAFMPGKDPFDFMKKGNWFSWAVLGLILGVFVITAAYTFNVAINWDLAGSWVDTEWFGFILLAVVAGIVAFVVARKS